MTIQVDFWQLLLAMAGLLGCFAVLIWGFAKMLLAQHLQMFAEDKTARLKVEQQISDDFKKMERDLLIFQRDLPLQYVRKEDYVRGQTIIESKLDALYSKLEVVQIKGGKNG
jgi:hypothetical protein